MYGVYDVVNKMLDRHVFEMKEDAQEWADISNKAPRPVRRNPRPKPHYEVREVVEDGFEEMLVGYHKHYKVVE